MILLAGIGLVCFLCYDLWTVRNAKATWPKMLFWAGLLCDAAVTLLMLFRVGVQWWFQPIRGALCALAALALLALLIYTLFFALPFDTTYRDPTKKRPVCRTGMYALCRHPGVVWFVLFYLMLFIAVPTSEILWGGVALCIGNLLYIIFQDLWTFPRTFSDYDSYRQEVPFLFPTAASIRRAWQTRRQRSCQS